MRVYLITIVTLMVGCGLVIGNESWAGQGTYRPKQSLTVSKQGTLLELIGADGTGRSTKKVTGDGFKLNYKTGGKSRSASATEMKTNQLRTLFQEAKYDGNKATAVVRTADESLEITSELIFDANAGELIIKRKFRNISNEPMILERVQNYIDPNVVVRGRFNQSAKRISAVARQITAGLAANIDDCDLRECTPPPVCPMCPPPSNTTWRPDQLYLVSRLYLSKRTVELNWSQPILLKPQLPQQPGGEVSIAIRVLIR